MLFWTVHRDIFAQKEPTRCTVYFQSISIINLYMFRAGLLLIIRRYLPVYTDKCLLMMSSKVSNRNKLREKQCTLLVLISQK